MAIGNATLILLAIIAAYGIYAILRQLTGAATVLSGMVLAGFIGYLVQSADGNRLASRLRPSPADVPHAAATPSQFAEEQAPLQQAAEPQPDRGQRASAPPGPAQSMVQAQAAYSTTPVSEPAPPVENESVPGGVRIVVDGFSGSVSDGVVAGALRSALQQADWDGLHSVGRKVLRVRGSLEDRSLTLGQIPTAAVALTWSLESASGAVLAEGGLADIQGTGVDDVAARAAAIRRAAGRVASEISQ